MKVLNNFKTKILSELIDANSIGVIPTDTIYGVIGSALSPRVVENIYDIKQRDRKKPMIVLIGSEDDLKEYFGIECPSEIKKFWPGKISVIFSCKKYPHIHRGKETIAFRIPDDDNLRNLLTAVGPVVAPSANPQGQNPAETITEAIHYFGEEIDFYLDGGFQSSPPSTLIKYDKKIEILRNGAFKIELDR